MKDAGGGDLGGNEALWRIGPALLVNQQELGGYGVAAYGRHNVGIPSGILEPDGPVTERYAAVQRNRGDNGIGSSEL